MQLLNQFCIHSFLWSVSMITFYSFCFFISFSCANLLLRLAFLQDYSHLITWVIFILSCKCLPHHSLDCWAPIISERTWLGHLLGISNKHQFLLLFLTDTCYIPMYSLALLMLTKHPHIYF